jgi:class 3 adenylate cyclase
MASETESPTADSTSPAPAAEAGIRTFLIADVRGYTRFTREEGDERAADLAATFSRLVREVIGVRGGGVIEFRGDEALSVFSSARQALRAAVELEGRFRDEDFPLGIGIGLDAGEAVPVEGGYRGAALNTASRLCAAARPGQILTTETVATLATRLEGVRVLPARPMRLKGFDRPLRVHEVVREPETSKEAAPERSRRRQGFVAVGVLLLVGAALTAVLVLRGNNKAAATGSHAEGGGQVLSKVDDPATILLGRSIGPVKLGMRKGDVHKKLGAPDSTSDWAAEGKTGRNEVYSPNGHYLRVSYFEDLVVQVVTKDSYYKTPTGVGVGVPLPPVPGSPLPGGQKAQLRPGMRRLGDGLYVWREIVNGFPATGPWCSGGFDAITRFDPSQQGQPGSAAGSRIVDVTMTKREFFEPLIDWDYGGYVPLKLSDLRC